MLLIVCPEAFKGMGFSQNLGAGEGVIPSLWAPAGKTSFAAGAVVGFANPMGRLWFHPIALQRATIPYNISHPEI